MLSYQHSYHAGCFADVVKHLLLTRILQYVIQKDNPLLYLDTHAGRGLYDLHDSHALKTNEAQQGVFPLWDTREHLSTLFQPYMTILEQLNIQNELRYYPGSPEIAIRLLRSQDRLVFCELHPYEFSFLQNLSSSQHRIFLKKENGLTQLNALLPPIERRGVVFMDPSYERKTEYQEIVQSIKMAYKRCPTMMYCLWYPLINHTLPSYFLKDLQSINAKNSLRLEFYASKKPNIGMTGSGLWVINPPYVLAKESDQILCELTQILSPESSSYRVFSQE